MAKTLDVLLLIALPASGKSEVRRYIAAQKPKVCERDFHLRSSLQLDDFPYVHIMRLAADELKAAGEDPIFFASGDQPLKEPRDWGTLTVLLNEDFDDLVARKKASPRSASAWMFERIDKARASLGIDTAFAKLSSARRSALEDKLESEAAKLLVDRNQQAAQDVKKHTVIIEFARGGKQGSAMPLAAPYGYEHAFNTLSDAICERASALYVWVSPEESRRKNRERANPNDPGSILHHGVPESVMLNEYGCDDIDYLLSRSDKPDTITIARKGKSYHVPLARFDNRSDKTSFVRGDPKTWSPENVKALHEGLTSAFGTLVR